MSSNIVNTMPYLRTTREYPENDAHQLSVEVNKSYVDIANAVNNRTIGIYPKNRPAINGESWFITSQRQQGLRQVYTFTAAGNIPHGLTISGIYAFTRIYGTVVDTNGIWYPLPYVDTVNVTNQISLSVGSTNISVTQGAGVPFTIANGYVVLDWIANV